MFALIFAFLAFSSFAADQKVAVSCNPVEPAIPGVLRVQPDVFQWNITCEEFAGGIIQTLSARDSIQLLVNNLSYEGREGIGLQSKSLGKTCDQALVDFSNRKWPLGASLTFKVPLVNSAQDRIRLELSFDRDTGLLRSGWIYKNGFYCDVKLAN